MRDLIQRILATGTFLQIAISVFSQSWSLVWREDFGVAEDTVIKNFADPTMTVPNHYFIEYEKVQVGYDNGAIYEFQKRPAGKEQCGQIDDGFYGIANSTAWAYNRFKSLCGGTGPYFTYGRDHTGNQNGAMLIINSGAGVGETIYGQDIDFDLCDAKKYRFKIFTSSITSFTAQEAMLTLLVKNRVTGKTVAEIDTKEIPLWEYAGTSPFSEHKWSEYYADFTANNGDKLSLQVINNSVSGVGNDFVIDDISLYRYDEDVEVPEMKIEESSIASATGGSNCEYEAQFSVVNSVLEAWQKIDHSVYVLWQKSEDGGLTWANITDQSGINASKLKMVVDGSETSVFRVIVTASPTDAEAKEQAEYIAAHNAPKNGCAYYSISNTISSIKPEPNCQYKETLREIWSENFGVCDTFGYATNSGMTLAAYTPGGKETMGQNGTYIVCSVPDSAIYHMSCDWEGKNCVKDLQFKPNNYNGVISPNDVSYFRSPEIGNAFAFIRMNKSDNKANPVFYKKTISVPLCPCKTFMLNAGFMLKGSEWGTNLVTKMTIYDKSGNELSSESVALSYKNGLSKKIASVPFSVPTGYSGDITVEMALDYTYNENNTSCADWTDFAIDDLSITICGETMPKPTISIDGNAGLFLLSGFECTDETPHKVVIAGMNDVLKEYPNAAYIWQYSEDGGATWKNLTSSSTSIDYEYSGSLETSYRVVIGETKAVAEEVAANGKPKDDCSVFYITNTVGFKCKEAGCRPPKFSFDKEDKVLTLDSVICGSDPSASAPEKVAVDVFQTNRVNVDDFYIATMGADKKYGESKVMTPTPASTEGKWTLSLEAKSAKYMIYAVNDTCKSDTLYINVDAREKIELKPVEDQLFCATEMPVVEIELASGKAEEILLKYGSHEGKAQVGVSSAEIKFADEASVIGETEVTAYAVDKDGKCKSEEITFKMDYEDAPSFEFSPDADIVCKGEKVELLLAIKQGHNIENHVYTVTDKDGNEIDLDDLVVFPQDQMSEYTASVSNNICGVMISQIISIKVEFPQAIDLATVPSPALQTSATGNIVCAPAEVSFLVSGDNLTTWDWEYRKKGEKDFSKWEAGSTSKENSIEITEETSFRVSSAVESSNACKAAYSDIITIEAENKPVFSLALDKDRVCETGDVELSLVSTEKYEDSQISATANGSAITLNNCKYSGSITETTKFEVTVAGKVCAETKFDTTAYVDHPLSFTMTPDKTKICEGDDVTFAITGESEGIVWYKSADGKNYSEFTPSSGNIITPDADVYIYAGTPSDGACDAFKVDPVSIDVEKALSFDLASDVNGKICAGKEVNLTVKNLVGTPKSSKWEKNGIEMTATSSLKDSPVSTTTYKLTLNGDVCPSVDHEVEIEVESADALTLTADKSLICEGESVTLTKDYGTNDPSVVTWWSEVDGVKTKISEISSVAPDKSTSYYLSVKGDVCDEVYSQPAIVDVEPKMDFELTSDVNGIVCEGSEITLSLDLKSGRADNVTFTANSKSDSYDIVKNKTYKVKPLEETTYELTIQGTACAAETKSVDVKIQKKPTLSVSIDKTEICEGDDITITPTAENVDGLIWKSSTDGGVTFTDDVKSTDAQVKNPTKSIVYSITTDSDDACEQVTWTKAVEVEPAFTVSFDDNSSVACPGEEVEIKAVVEGMSDKLKFAWKKSVDGTNYSSIAATSDPTVVKTKLDTTTQFSLTVTGKHCEAQTATTSASIDVVPTMTFEVSKDSVCQGDEVIFSAKFSADNFDETTIFIDNEEGNLVDGQQSVAIIPSRSMMLTAKAETFAGCAIKPASASVYVDKAILLRVPNDTTLCEGGKVKLSVSSNLGYSYVWTIDGDTLSQNNKFEYDGNDPVSVQLEAKSKVCKNTYDVDINVVPTPHIVSVEESGANKFEFVVEGGSGAYQFDFGKGFQSSSVLDPATYGRTYKVKVKDELGCASDTTIKTPTYELEFPVGFTPDGDGINDKWEIKNIDKYPSATIRLYDRFGKKLIDMKSSEMDGWDGTYNGHALPSTDYWYEIQIDEIDKSYTGHFTLIREKK